MANISENKNCYGCGVCSKVCAKNFVDVKLFFDYYKLPYMNSLNEFKAKVYYFPVLCHFQKSMSADFLLKMKTWVSEIASGSFKYVPLSMRIKVILKNLILQIK